MGKLNYIKNGVSLTSLTPVQVGIWIVVQAAFHSHGRDCTLTDAARSRAEGSPLSMHHVDRALDFRLNDMPTEVGHAVYETVRECLSDDFDVLAHGAGANWHLHVEFDPKG